ncbi:hypothetical protein [Desulfovibrio oxyclinae]|uniref:hypothetical protein n=1 Tax=Desulfovibrio oxyclinae TaxID=63560 RepID=UPI000375FCBD|nr:hypothetical protein [Desulfovibrio oxyclinae]
MTSSRIRPWLKWGLLLTAGLLLLLAAVPFSLNTQFVRDTVLDAARNAVGAPVDLDELRFSYSDGVTLRGLRVEGPAPMETFALEELIVRPGWNELLSGRVALDIQGRGVRLNASLPESAEMEEPEPESGGLPDIPGLLHQLQVPHWLMLKARIEDVAVKLETGEKRLNLSETRLFADVDGGSGRANVGLTGNSSKGAVAIAASVLPEVVSAEATLPGLELTAEIGDENLVVSVESDIARLTEFASPFLPPELPSVAGRFRLAASGPVPDQTISLQIQAGLENLRASGPSLPFPVELKLVETSCKVVFEPVGELSVREGRLQLPGLNTTFSARYAPSGKWFAAASGLRLDIPKLMALAAPLVPEDVRLGSGSVELRALAAEGDGGGPAAASVEGLEFAFGDMRVPGDVRVATLDGWLDSATVRLGEVPVADVLGLRIHGREVGLPALDRPLSGTVHVAASGLSAMPAVRDLALQAALDGGAVRFDLSGAVARRFSLSGDGSVNLAALGEYLSLPADSGTVKLAFDTEGIMPEPEKLQLPDGSLTASALLGLTDFLDRLMLNLRLDAVRLPRVAGGILVSSTEPLEVGLQNGLQRIRVELPVDISGAALPVSPRVIGSATITDLDQAEWNVRTKLPEQSLQLDSGGTASGITRLLRRGGDPLSALLSTVSARTRHRVALDGASGFDGRELSGKAELIAEADLLPDERLEGGLTVSLHELAARLGDIRLDGLQGEMRLRRAFPLLVNEQNQQPDEAGLSHRVLERGEAQRDEASEPAWGEGRLYFDALEVGGLPVPLSLSRGELVPEFGAAPGLRRFGFDLLGGSVRGSAVLDSGPDPETRLEAVFTSVDFSRLLDAALADPVAAGDASVNGRVRMTVPVQSDVRRILEEVGLEARIPSIGPSTLDAMLAAMDPHGADSAIAAQRRMVAMGGPRNLVITVRNGRLSLEGEVEAFGVRLKLPPVRRVSLADLPVRDMMEPLAEALGSVGRMARLWRAAAIILEDDGIRFSKRRPVSSAR